MVREVSGFLKDFMDMRKNLHKAAPPQIVSAVAPEKKVRASKGTADGVREELQGITVAKIIEEKPPKKEVMAYFQKECDRLTAEKMK
jgi:hypothetical protein